MNNTHNFAIIFDMDGVLIDSVAAAYRARSRLLAARGVDMAQIPDPHNEDHKGSSQKHLLSAVHKHTGIAIDENAFAQEARANMARDFQSTQVDSNLVAVLDELKQHDIPCAIASSGHLEGVRIKLDILGIEGFFRQIVTADDVTHHKPDPEIYLLTAKRLGVDNKNCVVIEDSGAGVAAGNSAGCTVVGFTQFNSIKQPLEGTALTVDGWDDLSYSRLRALLA